MTRQHVTVALSGDGGDELFAGYPRYKAVDLASRFDRSPWLRSLAAPWHLAVAAVLGSTKIAHAQSQTLQRGDPAAAQLRYLNWVGIFQEAARPNSIDQNFSLSSPSDPAEFLRHHWRQCGGRDAVTCASLADLTTYLPCDLMTKVDIASMAHGLEVRAPILDYRVVEFAASLPLRLKYRWGRGKLLLRDAFGHLLPREVFARRKNGLRRAAR